MERPFGDDFVRKREKFDSEVHEKSLGTVESETVACMRGKKTAGAWRMECSRSELVEVAHHTPGHVVVLEEGVVSYSSAVAEAAAAAAAAAVVAAAEVQE